jgi:hypothetical protein
MNEPRSGASGYRSYGKEEYCMRDRRPGNLFEEFLSEATGYPTLFRMIPDGIFPPIRRKGGREALFFFVPASRA